MAPPASANRNWVADATLRTYEAARWLEVGHLPVGRGERGKAVAHGGGVQHLVRDAVTPGDRDGVAKEVAGPVMPGLHARPGDHGVAVLRKQVFARLPLQLTPYLVRADGERDVGVTLAYGQPGDAGLAVGGAHRVRRGRSGRCPPRTRPSAKAGTGSRHPSRPARARRRRSVSWSCAGRYLSRAGRSRDTARKPGSTPTGPRGKRYACRTCRAARSAPRQRPGPGRG